MREIIAFIGSLAVGFLLAAAGLILEATVLLYVGLCLAGLAAVLWMFHWGKMAPQQATAPAAQKAHDGKAAARSHSRIVSEIAATNRAVGYALGDRNKRGMDAVIPRLKATLITVAKVYGLPTPSLDGSVERNLKGGAHYLSGVGAYLRHGHLDEAKLEAERLVPVVEEYVRGKRAKM